MTYSSGKIVIITGASSGIGKELALLFAKAGCKVGITGRRATLLNEIKSAYPAQIATAVFDVMGNENIPQLQSLIQKLGGMDLFIYNAGFGEASESLDPQVDAITVQTNVNGFAQKVNFAYHYFERQGYGHIAATSSIASMRGNHFAPAYSASKAFMSNYMEGLYIKARKLTLPITITDLQPGFVKTKMAKGPNRFWETEVDKAALQITKAIEAKKFRPYISRRWWLVAWVINALPGWLYRRIM